MQGEYIMEKSLESKTVGGLFWSFLGLLAGQGVSLLIQIVLARLLLPEDFGVIGIITVLVSVAETIVDSGFTNALIRDPYTSKEDYSTAFFFNLFVAVIVYIILFFSAKWISIFYEEQDLILLIRVVSIIIIINVFGLIQRTMLTKKVDFKSQTLVDIGSAIIAGIIAIILASQGFGVWSLVLHIIIRQVFQAIMYSIINRWYPSFIFSIKSFKRFYTFGWKLLLSSMIDTIYVNINNLIIAKLFTKDVLGYYTNASKLTNVVQQSLNGAVGKVSYPVLSNLQEDESKLKSGFRKIIKTLMFINVPIMIGLIVIAEPLILLLFGEKWVQVVPYFQLLCLPGMIFPLQAINLNILQVKGRSDLFLRVSIIKKIINIMLISIIIILKQGMIGLLWIGVLNSWITYLINSFYSSKLLKLSTLRQLKDIGKTIIAAVIMGAAVYWVGQLISFSLFINLALQVLTGVISYILLSKILRINELNVIWNLVAGFIGKMTKLS